MKLRSTKTKRRRVKLLSRVSGNDSRNKGRKRFTSIKVLRKWSEQKIED